MIENGFYWVRIKGDDGDDWTIGELDDCGWWLVGSGDEWREDHLKIGHKIERT